MSKNVTIEKKNAEATLAHREESRPEASANVPTARFTPRADILETPAGYVLRLDLPGVAPKDVDVHFEEGVLAVEAKGGLPEVGERAPLYAPASRKEYYRSFHVPENIAAASIEASVESGVLTLRLPKAEEARSRRITVQAK